MNLFTLVFWKRVWIWCKVNWKFLVGISIPIILSILLRKGNISSILKKANEAKEEQLKIEREAHGLEASIKADAQKEYLRSVNRITREHEESMELIQKNEKKNIESISTAEDATTALKNALDE